VAFFFCERPGVAFRADHHRHVAGASTTTAWSRQSFRQDHDDSGKSHLDSRPAVIGVPERQTLSISRALLCRSHPLRAADSFPRGWFAISAEPQCERAAGHGRGKEQPGEREDGGDGHDSHRLAIARVFADGNPSDPRSLRDRNRVGERCFFDHALAAAHVLFSPHRNCRFDCRSAFQN
jgi:hypothetical protein